MTFELFNSLSNLPTSLHYSSHNTTHIPSHSRRLLVPRRQSALTLPIHDTALRPGCPSETHGRRRQSQGHVVGQLTKWSLSGHSIVTSRDSLGASFDAAGEMTE